MAEEQEAERIVIPDEEGNDEVFEVLCKFDIEKFNKQYVMLVPAETAEEEGTEEVYAFQYVDNGDDLQLYLIEDDEEWEAVEATFETLVDEDQL